jgi:hypothetical protein
MAKIRIVGDSSGYVELAAPNAAGNNTLELPSNATKLVGADANNTITVGTGASIGSPATNVLTLGTNNSERVRVGAAGSIGIGTNNPSATLAVHDDSANPNSTPILYIQRSNNIVGNPTNANADLRIKSHSSNRKIYVEDHNSSPLFLLKGDGTIGIGTTNSSSKLQVQGTIGLGASDDLESGFSGGRTKLTSSASGFVINHNDNSATIFQNQGVERARISTSGNLGIGTNNPFAKTHIEINAAAGASSGSAAALWLRNANQTANNSATIFAGNDSSAACAAINFVHANYSNNQGFISFDTRENALTYNSNAMKIDAYGRVTTPYQVAFHVPKTVGDTLTTTAAKLSFSSATYDVGNNYSDANDRFTAPVAGKYFFYTSINVLNSGNASLIYIRKNGSTYGQIFYAATNYPRMDFNPVGIIDLAASDYVEIYGSISSGTITVDNAGYFGGYLLG